jgi:hypothetical protein
MSKATLSGADDIYVGRGYNAYIRNFWERKGVPVTLPSKFSLGEPGVADADYVVKAATSTELPDTETVTYTAATDGTSPLDSAATTTTVGGQTVFDVRDGSTYGRNLVSVVTHSSSIVAMTILISGFDYAEQPMSELHTITATGTSKTVTGTKAFAYVSSIAITAAADAEANTLNLGTGSVLGLPFKLAAIGDMYQASIGGVQELINVASNATVVAAVTTTATTSTGDVRGTITFNGTLDGSTECVVWYGIDDHASGAGLAGVAQA